MNPQALADTVANRRARIERGVGILKEDLHVPAQFAQIIAQGVCSSF